MENQPLEAAEGPIAVELNELGIANNTIIELHADAAKTALTFSKVNGNVVMNLSITFIQSDNIKFGKATIDASSLGIFDLKKPNPNFFKRGEFKRLLLSTDTADGVVISSENGDFKLITSATKKLSGGPFLPFQSNPL